MLYRRWLLIKAELATMNLVTSITPKLSEICLWHPLELPHGGNSNGCHQHIFMRIAMVLLATIMAVLQIKV